MSRLRDPSTVANKILLQIAGFDMKNDVGHGTLLKSEAAITIQRDYPYPLKAADSMSQ